MTNRSSRSRKKKLGHGDRSAATAGVEAQTAQPTENMMLPLGNAPIPESAPSTEAPPTSADSGDVRAAVAGEPEAAAPSDALESAKEAIDLAARPVSESVLIPAAERSSMRIEITEDRSSLGQRLRAAREARSWSREDVAHRLHVPTTVIADIEGERFERLGAPIYVRGYLSKYAALVGLPTVVVHRAIEGMSEPTLKASTDAPRVAATWERYRVAVIGAVITLAVAVPVLTLVANRGINAPVPQVRSLDESEMSGSIVLQPQPTMAPALEPAAPVGEAPTQSPPSAALDTAPVDRLAAAEQPVAPLAATAALPQPERETATPAQATAAVDAATPPALLASISGFATPTGEGQHVVELRFREDSWIEIFDASGRAIEQDLMRAGQSFRYESTGALSIKIGNVGGVDLQADGNPIDLAAHARANVARLRLFEAATTPTP
jgi:cytoskeleton protein RodZ